MRWAVNPCPRHVTIIARYGSPSLGRPIRLPATADPMGAWAGFDSVATGSDPMGAMAGFEFDSVASGPMGAMAGFDSGVVPSEPRGAMAGFDGPAPCCKCRATVSRWMP